MRRIKGYIFLAHDQYSTFMFGKKIDPTLEGAYQNIEGNGLIPYQTKEEAESSGKEFEKERKIKTSLAELEMKIAETDAEFHEFEAEESLVAIMRRTDFGHDDIYGPIVPGKSNDYPLPGAKLTNNGFKTFNTIKEGEWSRSAFERACYLASQLARQGDCSAAIATFDLKIIKTLKNLNS